MKKVTVLPGQTLFDIVVQEKGSLEGLFEVLNSNHLSLSAEVAPGDSLLIEGEPADRQRLKYLKQKNIHPATSVDHKEGIGNWIIEYDFIIN